MTVDADFRRQLDGYALATAEIYYRLPDAQSLLQSYLWQDYDMFPNFPKLAAFLDFWSRELDGPIHSVRLAHAQLLRPTEVQYRNHELMLH